MSENYFTELYELDVGDKVKQKDKLDYLPWSSAWAEIKRIHPDATYRTYYNESGRFWWDDGTSGWVRVGVTINGIEHIEDFPIMNFRNQPIPADEIKSTDANKAQKRGLVKACAFHGLGMYLYEGEELTPSGTRKTNDEKALAKKKKEIISLCSDLQNVYGVERDEILKTIAEYNDGGKNPNSIKSLAVAEELYTALSEKKGV